MRLKIGNPEGNEFPKNDDKSAPPVHDDDDDVSDNSEAPRGASAPPPFEFAEISDESYASTELEYITEEEEMDAVDPDAEVVVRLETVDGRFLASGETLEASVGRRIRVDVVSGDGTAARTYAIGILPDDLPRPTAVGTASDGWTFLGAGIIAFAGLLAVSAERVPFPTRARPN